ncbi:hypothetical protein [Paraliomyxa miuraensis]|uniref:hypothetical protein n=1 Tax=Paraliomyxa miuraensis TaxID=376150 RepID=UPI002256D41B|nr:hypothetical protein [Paraliomyxa miuraensis]MCX4239794.1 hypothetical protein [Paraliomyxa miuraensis]
MGLTRRVLACLLLAPVVGGIGACTTGVEDDPFATSFTGPQMTSMPPGVTTFEETEGPDSNDGPSTMGGSADDVADTTEGATFGSTSLDPGTTTNSEECNPPCAANEMCVLGACEPIDATTGGPPVCNDVPGNYGDCLGPGNAVDTSGCAGANNCITAGTPVIAGVCSITPCTDTCDCPGAPATGNAPIACDAITGGPEGFCFLDCSAGQTCPTGMVCFAELACVWPGEGADGVPYGDCFNNGGSICGLDGICLSDNVMAPTISVCSETCNVVGDCWPSPGGTAPVTCSDITTDGVGDCYLDCSLGQSCPAGMTCFGSFICAWN